MTDLKKTIQTALLDLRTLELRPAGDAKGNRIEYGPELLERFRRYFDVVKTDADSFTPILPFFHLRSSPFWHHRAVPVDQLKEDCDLSAKNPAKQADIDHMPPADILKLIQAEDEQVQTLLSEIGDLLEAKR